MRLHSLVPHIMPSLDGIHARGPRLVRPLARDRGRAPTWASCSGHLVVRVRCHTACIGWSTQSTFIVCRQFSEVKAVVVAVREVSLGDQLLLVGRQSTSVMYQLVKLCASFELVYSNANCVSLDSREYECPCHDESFSRTWCQRDRGRVNIGSTTGKLRCSRYHTQRHRREAA